MKAENVELRLIMSFLSIFDTLFLGPLKTILEIILYIINFSTHNVLISFIVIAFLLNLVMGSFYKGIHNLVEKLRQERPKYLRENVESDLSRKGEKNFQDLLFSLSPLLFLFFEVFVFGATCLAFFDLAILEEVSFGLIDSFASSDAIICFGNGFKINVLPFLFLGLGMASSMIYTLKRDLKQKLLLLIAPILFTIVMYDAPSGFVFFGIVYNTFLLIKTISYKFKKTKKFITAGYAVLFFVFLILSFWSKSLLILGIVFLVEPILFFIEYKKKALEESKFLNKIKKKLDDKDLKANGKQFIINSIFVSILLGLLIPSTYISASPQEYINLNLYFNPLTYVLSSCLLSFGFFMGWLQLFYWLSEEGVKIKTEKILFICSVVMIVDYMFFGLNLGIISPTLSYENGFIFSIVETIVNLIVVVAVCVFGIFAYKKIKSYVSLILILVVAVFSCMSTINIINSASSINEYKKNGNQNADIGFSLSTTGNNVIVIMLDRAMGQYVPFIFNEKPELQEKFDGFTHYKNTISLGFYTNIAAPAMLGGYEYTPVELNKRDEESLKDKNNEANLVLPSLFSKNGYKVSVSDPIYTNYQWSSDLSIYDEYENINAFRSIGRFVDETQTKYMYKQNQINFFRFSLMKTFPLIMQSVLYDSGNYNNIEKISDGEKYSNQKTKGLSNALGISNIFMSNYLTLKNLNKMTSISEKGENTFLFFRNDLTHYPMILDEENGYTPSYNVDNTKYDLENADRFNLNGIKLNITEVYQMSHYQANMAALIQVGNWLDYLRENDVYDNSRIIIVSDHGRDLETIDELWVQDVNLEWCTPLLMVKDFGETGFKISEEFMTNADVATLASQNLDFEAKNPFTGKELSMDEKFAHPQLVSMSVNWNVYTNDGNTFTPSGWLKFDSLAQDCNLYNKGNWEVLKKEVVLKKHSFT